MKNSIADTANRFLGLVRFSHTLFALPFALSSAALVWARHGFSWIQLAGIVACLALARAAAMAFNRLADSSFDAANPRTAGRHIPAGLLSVASVRAFLAFTSLGFVACTAVFLLEGNAAPLELSLPTLAWICGYSYAKRFTSLSHFWLGAALMLAPAAAWVVALGWGVLSEPWVPLLMGLGVFFWVSGFDIIYSTQDAEFDRGAGLHSMPALLGVRGRFGSRGPAMPPPSSAWPPCPWWRPTCLAASTGLESPWWPSFLSWSMPLCVMTTFPG